MILFVQAVKSHVMEINMYVTVNFKDCHCIHPNENLVLPMAGERRLEIYSSLQWLDQRGPLGF